MIFFILVHRSLTDVRCLPALDVRRGFGVRLLVGLRSVLQALYVGVHDLHHLLVPLVGLLLFRNKRNLGIAFPALRQLLGGREGLVRRVQEVLGRLGNLVRRSAFRIPLLQTVPLFWFLL